MITYIDTHAHLPLLKHDTTENILERARTSGVDRLVTVSTDETNWDCNRELAKSHSHIFYSVGLHPHDAARWSEVKDSLQAHFPSGKVAPKCVAIGELGLDFHYLMSPREKQLEALEGQLELARRHELPVIIHCRDAFTELFESLRRIGLSRRGGVMHCFTGTTPNATAALDLGLKISFSGIVTFKNAETLRETAKQLPLSEVVIETDCPFLAPIPFRGKQNEPSFLPMTALTLATVRGERIERIAEQTTQNAVELFRL